jgi:diguanylate cyclase (GGDEF)-like protein/PAS domain S-box-containing protein
VILLLIALIAGWFAADYLGKKARRDVIRESQAEIATLTIHVSSTFTNIEEAARSLAGSPWIAPALISKRDQDIERANSTLDGYNFALGASVSYLMDADGKTVASSNRRDPDSFVGKSYGFRSYFQEAAKGQPARYFGLGITSGKRGFYAGYPVRDPTGMVVGVAAMKKDLDEMESFFSEYPFCFLVSPDGVAFLSSAPAMVLKSLWPLEKTAEGKVIASRQFGDKVSGAVFKKEVADGMETTLEGKDFFVSRKVIYSEGWSIVLLTPTDRIGKYKLIGYLAALSVCLFIVISTGIIYTLGRSKEIIRKSEEDKRLLLDAAAEGIFGVDTAGRVTFINPAALRMLGFAMEEMSGQSVHALIHHSHKDGSSCHVRDCPMYSSSTKTAESHGIEDIFWHKNGRSFPVEYSSIPITKGGKVMGAVVTFSDITERKHAQAILQESEERYRTAIESSNDGIAIVEEDHHIYVNQKFLDIFGYEKQEDIIGKSPYMIVYPDDREMVLHYNRKRQSGDPVPSKYEFRGIKKDGGTIFIEASAAKITHNGKPASLAYLRDMTERKHLEEQLRTMSLTDELTGLYNRRGFMVLSAQQLKIAQRTKAHLLLAFVDLDKMKQINDTLGHQAGDAALVDIAAILKEACRESDIVGRMGGDEFAILAIDTADKTGEVLTNRLLNLLNTHNRLAGRSYRLSLSIGIAHFDPEKPSNLYELIAHADTRMYEDKSRGIVNSC